MVSRNTIVRVYCLSTDGGALDETFQLDMILHYVVPMFAYIQTEIKGIISILSSSEDCVSFM